MDFLSDYKAAIISDIHGNLTALEAIMKYIDKLDVDDIFCLGDVIGKGAFFSRTVDICRERCTETLRGNHEDFFLIDPDMDHYIWVRKELSPDQIKWLAECPVRQDLNISGRKIRLCHAEPENVHQRVYPKQEKRIKLEFFEPLDPGDRTPDVYGYGDVHYAYMELPQASFAVLTGNISGTPESSPPLNDYTAYTPFGIQFYHVPYDIQREVNLTLASTMPEKGRSVYLEEIKTGTWGKRWRRHT